MTRGEEYMPSGWKDVDVDVVIMIDCEYCFSACLILTLVFNPIPYGLRLPPIPYGGGPYGPPYLKSQKMVGWG